MTPDALLYVEIGGLVFQAGMFYAAVRYLRRDVNGLGKKQRDTEAREDKRYRHIAAAVILSADKKHRAIIIQLLLGE